MDIILTISKITNIPYRHIEAVTDMLQNGDTIPFISRYRKEATGSLDEVAIFNISKMYDNFTALEKRKKTIIDTITEQGRRNHFESGNISNDQYVRPAGCGNGFVLFHAVPPAEG